MINSLDVFSVGKPWPPADQDERDRIAEHQKNRKLYEELHLDIFPKYNAYINDKLHDDKKQTIILGLAETATTNFMDLLLGEAPEIEAPRSTHPRTRKYSSMSPGMASGSMRSARTALPPQTPRPFTSSPIRETSGRSRLTYFSQSSRKAKSRMSS